MYIGIDYSISSPAMCIMGDGSFKIYYIIKNKKYISTDDRFCGLPLYEGIYGVIDRYYHYAMEFINILKDIKIDRILIEGYSYGSVSRGRDIAECTGVFKGLLYHYYNIMAEIIPPKTWKKKFCGTGNADKLCTYDKFINDNCIDFTKIFPDITICNNVITGNPISDIVDSYGILSII